MSVLSFVAMNRQTTVMRRERRLRDLTLDEVRSKTGIDIGTISRIERGLISGTEAQRNALAGYFGRPIDELLGPVPKHEAA
jgi:transcriptional regulator with XRE-family HTH domain